VLGIRLVASLSAAVVTLASTVSCSILTNFADLSSGGPSGPQDEAGGGSDGGRDGGARPDVPAEYTVARALTIANGATTSLVSGYAVCFAVPSSEVAAARAAGTMRSDFGDVRIFGPGGERPRVVDLRRLGSLSICFKTVREIPAGGADTGYTIAYGNAGATAPAGAEDSVFAFFDGFDGSSLASRWVTRGAPIVHDGVCELPGATNEPGITAPASSDGIPPAASLEMRIRVVVPNATGLPLGGGETFYYWFGFQRAGSSDYQAAAPYTYFISNGPAQIEARHETPTGPCNEICTSGDEPVDDAFRVYRIDRTAQKVRFIHDSGAFFEAVGDNGDLAVMIRSFLRNGAIEIDWVRARPLVLPDAVVAIGP